MVSLIIPTYNRKHTLVKVIDSYLKQEALTELIFVDDGSTDGTYEYLDDLKKRTDCPAITLLRHEENRGLPAARNTGIQVARGQYIMMGEDDVFLTDSYVSTLVNCLKASGADIMAGRILYQKVNESYDETIQRCDAQKGNLVNYWLMSAFYSLPVTDHVELPFLHSIAIGKATIYKDVLFDIAFHAREETDFYLRAGKAGARIMLCPHAHCFHLPQDTGRGGGWSMGVLKYQMIATKNNTMLVNRHYDHLKKNGMKGNKYTFTVLHILNRFRIVFKYLANSYTH